MPRDLKREEAVFTLGTGADVMDHLVAGAFCEDIAYDPNMRNPTRQLPCHNVPRQIIRTRRRDRKRLTLSAKANRTRGYCEKPGISQAFLLFFKLLYPANLTQQVKPPALVAVA
jgi:hypothetical protein